MADQRAHGAAPNVSLDEALSAVCEDLSYLTGQAVMGSRALRGALTHRDSCSGPEAFSNSLQELVAKADSLTETIVAMEAQTTDCISLAELLGHCEAALTNNQKRISGLQDHLEQYGYRRPTSDPNTADPAPLLGTADDAAGGDISALHEQRPGEKAAAPEQPPAAETHADSTAPKGTNQHDWSAIEDQSPPLNVHALGLSKASLAAIHSIRPSPELDDTSAGPQAESGRAAAGRETVDSPVKEEHTSNTMELYREIISRHTPHHPSCRQAHSPQPAAPEAAPQTPSTTTPAARQSSRQQHTSRPQSSIRKPLSNVNYTELAQQRSMVKKPRQRRDMRTVKAVTSAEFAGMPNFLVSRLSLETLNKAVDGINSAVHRKAVAGADEVLEPEDLEQLSLGISSQSVLGCLVRMDRILLDTTMGRTVYRLLT